MTEKLLRTFLAVPVPRDVSSKKNMLYSTLENVDGDINWVKNAQLHLTMKFLGHTPESAIIDVIDHVEKITPNMNPFDLKIEETGCFPVPTRPRVLWLGIEGETEKLIQLVTDLNTELEQHGFPAEPQQYTPHITLARIKYPPKHTPDIESFLQTTYEPINMMINRVQFLRSELFPNGPVYSILGTHFLAPEDTKEN